jgi:cell division protein FtsI (penicillin-binding protein 3)
MRLQARRLRLLRALFVLVFLSFGAKLFWMQVVQGADVAAQVVEDNMVSIAIAAPRGEIQDVNGLTLASTIDARDIVSDQTMIRDPRITAERLAPVLGADPVALADHLTGTKRFVYIAKEVSPQDAKRISDLNIAGVYIRSSSRRVYPQGELAANILGFVNSSGSGAGGVEHSFDSQLTGTPGHVEYMQAGGKTLIPTGEQRVTEPIAGSTVRLTIDRDVQWIAQRAIAERVAYARAASGTVVVLDTTNGHIVAMATAPTFDPNHYGDAEPADRGNRAVSDVYEPGSTAKVMTMSAVIEEGAAQPESRFSVPWKLRWKQVATFHDHESHPTEKLTLTGILAKSSNVGTIKAATRLGDTKLYDYLTRFGIGSSTRSGLAGESSGLLPSLDDWSTTTFPTLAFGQGMSVSALQVAQVFATIANDGVRITPTIVAGLIGPDGKFVGSAAQQTVRVVSVETARKVRSMMETVVSDEGTAPGAAIPGYRVAGKTGTAERFDDSCGCYRGFVASFIGIAPADKPRFVVAVALTDPRNGRFGSLLGGPVFKEVMTYVLQKWRVAPSGAKAPALPTTWK